MYIQAKHLMLKKWAMVLISLLLISSLAIPAGNANAEETEFKVDSIRNITVNGDGHQLISIVFNKPITPESWPVLNFAASSRTWHEGAGNPFGMDENGFAILEQVLPSLRNSLKVNGRTVGEIMAEENDKEASFMIHLGAGRSRYQMDLYVHANSSFKLKRDGTDTFEILAGFADANGHVIPDSKQWTGGVSRWKSESQETPISDTDLVSFYSSDAELDRFINSYLERHLRYNSNRIGPLSLGNSVLFNKEWESMALLWMNNDSEHLADNRRQMLKDWIYSIPVDKFGYVWSNKYEPQPATGGPGTYFNQGWPFPDYSQSTGKSAGWEFNAGTGGGWTANGSAPAVKDGYAQFMLEQSVNEVVSPSIDVSAFHSPFAELDFDLRSADGSASRLDKISGAELWWTTKNEPQYSESNSVDLFDYATLSAEQRPGRQYLHLPMYLHDGWAGETITGFKLVVKTDSSEPLRLDMNFVRMNYDTRHANNQSLLITSSMEYYLWSGDEQFLSAMLPKLRSAMQFYLTHLNGETGLIDQNYFTGHDGVRGVGRGIGNGYWDIISTGPKDSYSNVYYYKAVIAMQVLEQAASDLGLNAPMPSVVAPLGSGTVAYAENAQTLADLRRTIETAFRKPVSQGGFWDAGKGRFIIGVNALGQYQDYGLVAFNLEMVDTGLASEEQQRSIMDWVSGQRIVSGDTSTGADIYAWEFAPRATTKKNENHYIWVWGGGAFGTQVQDGGSTAYISYYDLMSRLKVYGADDAFNRLKGIQAWYNKVEDAGGEGTDFYRAYYRSIGTPLQGGGTAGAIGLDEEFLEAALLYAAIPRGFLGLQAENGGLVIAPQIPDELDYWGAHNLQYHGTAYDLKTTNGSIEITNIRGDADRDVKAVFSKPEGVFRVFKNGVELASPDWSLEGGKIVIPLSMEEAGADGSLLVEVESEPPLVYELRRSFDAPAIDGAEQAGEWAEALEIPLSYEAFMASGHGTSVMQSNPDLERASGTMRLKWNDAGISFLARMNDADVTVKGKAGEGLNAQDGIQFVIDPLNRKRSGNEGVYIFDFAPATATEAANERGPAAWFEHFQYNAQSEDEGVQVASTLSDDGYQLEGFIPWTALQKNGEALELADGAKIGFGIIVLDFKTDGSGNAMNDAFLDYGYGQTANWVNAQSFNVLRLKEEKLPMSMTGLESNPESGKDILLDIGETKELGIVLPKGADEVSVSVSDESVATAALTGTGESRILSLHGLKDGSTDISVAAVKSGYKANTIVVKAGVGQYDAPVKEKPTYTAARAFETPVLDGKRTAGEWEQAAKIDLSYRAFVQEGVGWTNEKMAAEAVSGDLRLQWSDEGLYWMSDVKGLNEYTLSLVFDPSNVFANSTDDAYRFTYQLKRSGAVSWREDWKSVSGDAGLEAKGSAGAGSGVIEGFIPWSAFDGLAAVGETSKLGFGISLASSSMLLADYGSSMEQMDSAQYLNELRFDQYKRSIYVVNKSDMKPVIDGVPDTHEDDLVIPVSYDKWVKEGTGTSLTGGSAGYERPTGIMNWSWTEEGLYFATEVKDADMSHPAKNAGEPLNSQDAVQMLIDPVRTYATTNENAYIFDFVPASGADRSGPAAWYEHWKYEGMDSSAGIETAGQLKDDGYVLEAFIPWSALTKKGETFTPQAGHELGIGLIMLDFAAGSLNDMLLDHGNSDSSSLWNSRALNTLVLADVKATVPTNPVDPGTSPGTGGGTTPSDNSGVKTEELKDSRLELVKKLAQQRGLALIEPILEVTIPNVTGNEASVPVGQRTEVKRTVSKPLDGKSAAVLAFDEASGDFTFVPALFTVKPDGTTEIVMKVSGSGIYVVVENEKSFVDVKSHWAETEIRELASKLIVNGVSDTLFKPDADITRAEFTAILVRALGLEEAKEQARFDDVSGQSWYAGAVGAEVHAGLITGYSTDSFKPDQSITRQEMAVMMSRLLNELNMNQQPSEQGAASFSDQRDIAGWAAEAVAQAAAAGIVNGKDGKFAPNEQATRAQTAVMVIRLLRAAGYIN